ARPARGPDAILYEPKSGRVLVFDGGSDNATAIDAKSARVVATVDLGGAPEAAVADGRGRVYVNLEDRSAIVRFDARSLKIEGRWSLAPGEGPTGIAVDDRHRRLFAGCRNRR